MSMNKTISLCERVLNVADPHDPLAISKAHHALTGEHVSTEQFLEDFSKLKAIRRLTPGEEGLYKMLPDQTEQFVASVAIRGLFQGDDPYANVNMFNGWPMYQDLYSRFGRQTECSTTSKRSLLLGSLSALSSKAFVAMSSDIYGIPPTAAHIIDPIVGKSRKRHGTVVQASALDMPFTDNSMDIVHSHALLHMILRPSDSTVAAAAQQLFRETFRVLRSGGNLLAYETIPGFKKEDTANPNEENDQLCDDFKNNITSSLQSAGFTVDTVEDAWQLSGDFLFDRGRDFGKYPRIPFRRAIMIAALKEPA